MDEDEQSTSSSVATSPFTFTFDQQKSESHSLPTTGPYHQQQQMRMFHPVSNTNSLISSPPPMIPENEAQSDSYFIGNQFGSSKQGSSSPGAASLLRHGPVNPANVNAGSMSFEDLLTLYYNGSTPVANGNPDMFMPQRPPMPTTPDLQHEFGKLGMLHIGPNSPSADSEESSSFDSNPNISNSFTKDETGDWQKGSSIFASDASRRENTEGTLPDLPTKREPQGQLNMAKMAGATNGTTRCTNCSTTTTPLWRRNPEGQPLCNACGLFLKLHGVVRPLSLKTDVIKKRNRSSGAAQPSKSKAKSGISSSSSNSKRISANDDSLRSTNSSGAKPTPPASSTSSSAAAARSITFATDTSRGKTINKRQRRSSDDDENDVAPFGSNSLPDAPSFQEMLHQQQSFSAIHDIPRPIQQRSNTSPAGMITTLDKRSLYNESSANDMQSQGVSHLPQSLLPILAVATSHTATDEEKMQGMMLLQQVAASSGSFNVNHPLSHTTDWRPYH